MEVRVFFWAPNLVEKMNIKLFKNDLPDELEIKGDLAIDTEAMGLNPHRDPLCLIQISTGNQDAYLIQFENRDYSAPNLKKLLNNPDSQKIFHYARFDVAIIYQYLGIELKNIFCTKIASKLVRTYTDCHGLKDLCRELLNVQISKQQQSSYWGSEQLTKEQKHYAAADVLHLHDIREILLKMLAREDRLELFQKCCDFIFTRAKLDLLGWPESDIFAYKS
jgi:ribonuclease D